jgi:hypothetical protein
MPWSSKTVDRVMDLIQQYVLGYCNTLISAHMTLILKLWHLLQKPEGVAANMIQ